MPVGRDRYELARLLDLRLQNAAWWVERMQKYPSGIVTVGVFARMMGVSKSRVSELVQEGRLTILDGLPTGHPRLDRFVPFNEFLTAPNALYRGRKFDRPGLEEPDPLPQPAPLTGRKSGSIPDYSRQWPSKMGLNSDYLPP